MKVIELYQYANKAFTQRNKYKYSEKRNYA